MTVKLIIVIFLLIVLFIMKSELPTTPNQSKLRSNESSEPQAWSNDSIFGVPILIALNSINGPQVSPSRRLILYLEPQYFDEESIKKVLIGLAKKYPEPNDFYITAYSDKAMIQRAIDAGKSTLSVDYINGPQGERAYQKYAEQYLPLKSGYYRANYKRMNGEEKLDYSPDPNKEEQVTLIFKKREPAYTGDPTHDLILAIEEGDSSHAKKLIHEGADINSEVKDHSTVLITAILQGHSDIVNLLLSKGVDINAQDEDGWTALMSASSHGETEIVRELIRRGAAVNPQNNGGFSALMLAANEGFLETVKLLLESGADLNAKSQSGETAFTLARRNHYDEVVRLLKALSTK